MISTLINHIVFVIDASGSMHGIRKQTVKVFDEQIKSLKESSVKMNQETRISVYFFNYNYNCIVYDMDVMRMPSLDSYFSPSGGTALIDATYQSILDLEKTAQLYGDHAFLLYVLTDGDENSSTKYGPVDLQKKIDAAPENWTFAVFVPNDAGVRYAAHAGFPQNNIIMWDTTTSAGITDVAKKMATATTGYMTSRSKGIRGTKNLFTVDTTQISKKVIKTTLVEMQSSEFFAYKVSSEDQIRDFVEKKTKLPYVKGNSYYELMKTEMIQGYKKIIVEDTSAKKFYSGDNARNVLGLPNTNVKVNPQSTEYANFKIYVQSTSVNRKLVPNTKLVVLK